MNGIESQTDLLYGKLKSYYNDKENLEKMFNLITSNTKISLRIIDWFVTNFAKKQNTNFYITLKSGDIKRVVIHNEYKLKLKSYSKRFFDPFCRHIRINFPYSDDKYFETTLGQLNFFKWIIENEIDKYLENHYDEIDKDMNTYNSSSKKKSKEEPTPGMKKTRKKREELSTLATKSIKREDIDTVISFNASFSTGTKVA
jgi:hypothetical protein